jgi:hypothetical protein
VIAILLIAAVLTALGTRRFSNPAATARAANRMLAHLLEFRLFLDEPALILQAQRDLIAANFQLLRSLAIPILLPLIPAALLLAIPAPLTVGEPAVLTLPYQAGETVRLTPPPGIAVESEGVRTATTISFRIRPMRATHGEILVARGSHNERKPISAGPAANWLACYAAFYGVAMVILALTNSGRHGSNLPSPAPR